MDSLPSHVRITLASGERVVMTRARLEADSVVGMVDPDTLRPRVRRAIPADSVQRVAARGRTAESRTTSFMGGVAAATAAFWLLLVHLAN